jgi:hypothetical protein
VALEYPFLNAPSGFSYAYFMVIIRITDHTTNCLRIYGICIIEIDSSCIKKPTELKGDSLYQLRSSMAEGGEP